MYLALSKRMICLLSAFHCCSVIQGVKAPVKHGIRSSPSRGGNPRISYRRIITLQYINATVLFITIFKGNKCCLSKIIILNFTFFFKYNLPSQFCPEYRGGHVQLYLFTRLEQLPWTQGFDSHSSTSVLQLIPAYPGVH